MKARTSMNGLLLIFFIVQASEQLQVPLSSVYPLGYYILFTFMISWNTSSNTISSHSGTLAVMVTNCYSHIYPTCPRAAGWAGRQMHSPHLWDSFGTSCLLEKGRGIMYKGSANSEPTYSLALLQVRNHVSICLIQVENANKKGPVLPKNAGGKPEG